MGVLRMGLTVADVERHQDNPMKRLPIFPLIAVAAGFSIAPVTAAESPDPAALKAKAKALFPPMPDKMPGAEKDTPARVELGKKLYFEKNISANRTQSCNSCHQVEPGKAGVDGLPTSPGAFGKFGGRNSPTTLNAGFHLAQFWDGRAATLEDQAKGPVLNPGEMAMPNPNAEDVIKRLAENKDYEKMFAEAFPNEGEAPMNRNPARINAGARAHHARPYDQSLS